MNIHYTARGSAGAPIERLLERLHGVRRSGGRERQWSARCPAHDDRTPSLSVREADDGRVLLRCHAGCEANAIVAALGLAMRDLFAPQKRPPSRMPAPAVGMRARLAPAPAPRPRAGLADWARDLWAGTAPVAGTIGERYLRGRGCVIPPADGDLRYHPALRHPTGYRGPALVALATDVHNCQPLTLHRTWVRADGRKADVDPPRLLAAGHPKAGGVIRLWPDAAVTHGLCVAEGIETALAAAHVFVPVWACCDAGNLAALPVLGGIEALTVVADHDPAGVRAARSCAQRWAAGGREARIVMSATPGHDLADEVLS